MTGMRGGQRLDVLYIDDDADTAQAVASLLRIFHDVRFAVGVQETVAELQRRVPDVVLCDLEMPPFRGYAILAMIRREHPSVRRILFTGSPPRAWMHVLEEQLAHVVIRKPGGIQELLEAISPRKK